MKNKAFVGCYVLFGAAIGGAPRFTVCAFVPEAGFMPCWETAKMMSFLGLAFMLMGFLLTFAKKWKSRLGLNAVAAVTAALGALIPMKLIGGCANLGMPCHTVAFPVIYALLSVLILISLAGAATNCLEARDGRKRGTAWEKGELTAQ